ncbi:MAG: carboxypeptidase regulatory-like domain-containing protein [Terriglobia bacterium]
MLRQKGVWFKSSLNVVIALAASVTAAWSHPQTQDLKGVVASGNGSPIAGAVCTLKGIGLPAEGIGVTTNERGEFDFPGLEPREYDLVCVAVGHLPAIEAGLRVAAENPTLLQIVLPESEKLRQSVEVHESATPLATENTPSTGHVNTQQLSTLPLVHEEFLAALPLVPGVVRTPDGKINIKGSEEGQSMLLVNNTEMVDPITGSYSIDLPPDAIESLDVSKTPYNAEYGHFSGGLTTVVTKPPSDKWDFQLYDVVPSFRFEAGHLSGVDGNSPRIRFTGPLNSNRLTMSESFTYFMHKQIVRGLPWPHDQTIQQGVNSFTNFQYVVSSEHLLTFNLHVFPDRQEWADSDSLVPQTASSNYGQRGFSVGTQDRRVFASGGLLSMTLQYTRFSSYGHGQGITDMQVTPNGWGGNFFNAYTRTADQGEARETYQFPRREWHGKHELKVGGDGVYRTFGGVSRSMPVNALRLDGSLAEQITFSGPGLLSAHDLEIGIFAQDHWALGDRFAVDAGLRFSGQTLGSAAAISPRLGFEYAPGKNNRTILRGGAGVFYSGMPLLGGSFIGNPERVITLYNPLGGPLGPPVTLQNVYAHVDNRMTHILPPGQDLESTPYNVTWNLELDRELGSRVTLRLSYLASRTYDLFVVGPQQLPGTSPLLLMTNTGGSRYQEFESTLRYRTGKYADIDFSYVHSSARGDLNVLSQVYVPFEEPVIRPNFFSALNSDIPNRFLTWGQFKLPWKITASPVLDLHTGYPYSALDALQNYVGQPNSLRLPTFLSLDLKLGKDFRIPFLPWVRKHTLRGAIGAYNVTNHLNPRDVYNNVTSPYFGHVAGPQHRTYEPFIDFVY